MLLKVGARNLISDEHFSVEGTLCLESVIATTNALLRGRASYPRA
jgi:hypothetical protein